MVLFLGNMNILIIKVHAFLHICETLGLFKNFWCTSDGVVTFIFFSILDNNSKNLINSTLKCNYRELYFEMHSMCLRRKISWYVGILLILSCLSCLRIISSGLTIYLLLLSLFNRNLFFGRQFLVDLIDYFFGFSECLAVIG